MSEWMPIETAPKDGTEFLAFGKAVKDFPVIAWDDSKPREAACCVIRWKEAWYDDFQEQPDGSFKKVQKQGYAFWSPHPQQFRPTHWMPIPAPPL